MTFALTPRPPYFAVIFTSELAAESPGYAELADRMVELAAEQPGYLGIESARGADGLGITVSYWSSREAIAAWKKHAEHQVAQQRGKSEFYRDFRLRIVGALSGRAPILWFRDWGIGVVERDRERIFEHGARGSNVHEVQTRGTGLGLAICRQILAEYGASIALTVRYSA